MEIGFAMRFNQESIRRFAVAAVFPALMCFAPSAPALTVTYGWVNAAGSNGVGSITFNSAGITNPASFSGVAFTNISGLSYKWTNGSSTRSITLSDVTFWQVPFNFSASGGFLTTQFNAADFPTNSFSLQGAPNPALSLNSLAAPFTDSDSGFWQLQAVPPTVPLPGALALLASGVALFAGVARRRHGG